MFTKPMEFIGIDGCRIGWICIGFDSGEDWQHKVVTSADELVALVGAAKLTLIDIPIGLLDSGSDERVCDRAARRKLGAPRASSVFPAPVRGKFRECHPEVCFWSLNGMQSMQHNKKKSMGRNERIIVLSRYLPQTREIVNAVAAAWPRRQVAWVDIIDALVAAVTAKFGYGNLMTLPEEPPVDACGLAMEMIVAKLAG